MKNGTLLLLGLSCALCAGSYQDITAKEAPKALPAKEAPALKTFKGILSSIRGITKAVASKIDAGKKNNCATKENKLCQAYMVWDGINQLAFTVSDSTLQLIDIIQAGKFDKLAPFGPCLKLSDEELRDCFEKMTEKKPAGKDSGTKKPDSDSTDLCSICPAAGCVTTKACAASLLKAFFDTGLPKLLADMLVGSVETKEATTAEGKPITIIHLGLLGQGANTLSFVIENTKKLRDNKYLSKLNTALKWGNKKLTSKIIKDGKEVIVETITPFEAIIMAIREFVNNADMLALLIGGDEYTRAIDVKDQFSTDKIEVTKGEEVNISATDLANVDFGDAIEVGA